jgi:teichuronic acid exporter
MSLRRKALNGMSWSFLVQFANQVVGFTVTVLLSRLLMPADFGVIGIVSIFIGFANILSDGGTATSLIRTKEVTDLDYSTIFFSNLFVSILLYLLLFSLSPYIASFFDFENLESLLRIYGLMFIISSFTIVQSIRLNKKLDFKTQFKLLLPSLFISATIGIWMAMKGYGIWSLVVKDIVFSVLSGIQLWIYSKWQPTLVFDWKVFKYHFVFGYKLMLTEFIKRIFKDGNKIVLGKLFPISQLGLFTRAQSMQELPTSVLFNAFNRVAFPLLAEINDDNLLLKRIYRKLVTSISFIVIPLLTFLGVFAKPIFVLLLTEKWNEAIPYFQILILGGIFAPLRTYNLNICKVKGRSDLILKFTIFECLLMGGSLFSVFWFGINGILWSLVLVNIILTIITGYFSGKLIAYSLKEQLMDILPILILSFFMCIAIFELDHLICEIYFKNYFRIIIGGLIFSLFYFSIAYFFKMKSLVEILIIFKNRKLN